MTTFLTALSSAAALALGILIRELFRGRQA